MTLDPDFGDIRVNLPKSHTEVWVLRPAAQNVDAIIELLRGALARTGGEPVAKRLWVIEPGEAKIRE